MLTFMHLKSFFVYNLILLIIFSIITNSNHNFSIIYTSLYCAFHFLLIYLTIYHNKKILYLIYFFYGLFLDIIWLNEIGPHLITFMLMIGLLNLSLKYLYNLNQFKMYLFLYLLQISMIFIEMFLSIFLFNIYFDFYYIIQILILSIIISYPVFIIFSKIDNI